MDEEKEGPLPKKTNSDVGEEISKQFYDPLDNLTPKQQKFAMMQVTTTLSAQEVANRIGISAHMRRKWQKDEHVKAYLKQCQKRYNDQEMIDVAKRQTQFIRENLFNEIIDRFEDPDEALERWKQKMMKEYGREPSVQEEIDFRERFAKNASFKDFMKIWKDMDKLHRLDSDQATEKVDDGSIERRAKRRYTKFKARQEKNKTLEKKAEEVVDADTSFEEFKEALGDGEEDSSDEEVVEAEFEEDQDGEVVEETITLEEWEIS